MGRSRRRPWGSPRYVEDDLNGILNPCLFFQGPSFIKPPGKLSPSVSPPSCLPSRSSTTTALDLRYSTTRSGWSLFQSLSHLNLQSFVTVKSLWKMFG